MYANNKQNLTVFDQMPKSNFDESSRIRRIRKKKKIFLKSNLQRSKAINLLPQKAIFDEYFYGIFLLQEYFFN